MIGWCLDRVAEKMVYFSGDRPEHVLGLEAAVHCSLLGDFLDVDGRGNCW